MKKLILRENERIVKYITLLLNSGIKECRRPQKSLQAMAKQMASNFSTIN